MSKFAVIKELARQASPNGYYSHSGHGNPLSALERAGLVIAEREPISGSSGYFLRYSDEARALEREIVQRVSKLAERYRRYCRYMREGRHQWSEVEGQRIFYADNAVEILERSVLGFERRREIVAPHGDVCF